jgi:hypothetical protein
MGVVCERKTRMEFLFEAKLRACFVMKLFSSLVMSVQVGHVTHSHYQCCHKPAITFSAPTIRMKFMLYVEIKYPSQFIMFKSPFGWNEPIR